MSLFCAAIWRDSISLLRFPFLSHVQVFLCKLLLIRRLKHSLRCFSIHSLFLSYCHSVGHRVISIISGGCNQSSFVFFLESLYRCINAFFIAGKSLPHPYIDTYSLSTSSLGCNALYMVISFPVLWSLCLSSSLVHFKKGPKYLTRDTAQVFI